MKNIFEKSVKGRIGVDPGTPDTNMDSRLDPSLLRKTDNMLPEVSELEVVRHYTNLSRLNYSVDTHFYPLGSCTMKYNPKINEVTAVLPGFINAHPMLAYVKEDAVQGALEVIYKTSEMMCEITGMKKMTTQPYAGAHGEMTGILLMAQYHKVHGNNKTHIIVPESAHGTNPASAAAAGYEVVTVPVNSAGGIDLSALKEKMNAQTAGIMMTVPSTLGVFEKEVLEVSALARKFDALMYYDGANLNAIMGKARPGDMGFDIVHLNLHKTFSTPHGGGGPGAGMVGVSERLADFVPVPAVAKTKEGKFTLDFNVPHTIGNIASFFGNFGVMLKAYTYITMLGKEGLIEVSEKAVLNANYIMAKLKPYYYLPYDRTCMHEAVFSAKKQVMHGVHALDIAKALIDRGFHPPTIYFPLVVEEAIMIEPTETESKQDIDLFIEDMIDIAKLAETDPDKIKNTPVTTPVSRPDETKAAREPRLKCF
ncbi:MAG: aminomethyl-transferring glycine dehydrogenase subunit GcvPB [Candidatus Goldbacteria bacterium]|nr:aminomethyl-transferring glycine dehydrogenase subunit GcvPB [Candidatus Goldiibacteriota bacterium]